MLDSQEELDTVSELPPFRQRFELDSEDSARILGFTERQLLKSAAEFHENGYLVIPGFYSANEVKVYSDYVDYLWEVRERVPVSVDTIHPGFPNKCLLFKDVDIQEKSRPYKLNDLFLVDSFTRSLSLSRRLGCLLSFLVENLVAQCNSLNFEYGSQQAYHFDTFYMPPPPGGQLIVSSICLEDVSADAGPLSYWPRSHVYRPWLNALGTTHCLTSEDRSLAVRHFSEIAKNKGLSPRTFLGKAGDLFLWHQQLFHGGLPIRDDRRTRRSLVSHYWSFSSQDLPSNYVAVNSFSGFLSRKPKSVWTPSHEHVDG